MHTYQALEGKIAALETPSSFSDSFRPRTLIQVGATFTDIPNEIFFRIIDFMPLCSLILCRSICKSWRNLVKAANIPPARRHLLTFYDSIINSFDLDSYLAPLKVNPQSPTQLYPKFDHEAESQNLLTYFQNVPSAFVLWSREWPGPSKVYYYQTDMNDRFFSYVSYGKYEMGLGLLRRRNENSNLSEAGVLVGHAHARRICECPGVNKTYQEDPAQHQPHTKFEIRLDLSPALM